MALPFPLIPVLVGAAVGSAVTYILTSRKARKQLTDSLDDLGDAVDGVANKAKDVVEDAADVVSDAATKAASKGRRSSAE